MNNNDEKYINLDEINLLSNIPKSFDEYENYAKLLSKTIKDEKIKNIGIIAPYGAGKSSVIQKYLDNEKKRDAEIEEKIITISLSNYNSIVKNKTKDDKKLNDNLSYIESSYQNDEYNTSILEEKDIEKSILQQLFYKNDNKNTPFSRFIALKNNTAHNIYITLICIILLICITSLIMAFSDIRFKFLKYIRNSTLIIIMMFLLGFVSVGLLIFEFIKSKQLKNLNFGNISFEKNLDNEISVFNEYLDEIIYFFQNNKYNILLIEDLDRFENLNIFSKFKELNTLLNNNEKIVKKHKKITFIYAVKDSMFKNEEERSKFFEFIIPIIPSITRDNVKDELENYISKLIPGIQLDSGLVIDISDYIMTRRVLNNIINDLIIHMAILKFPINDKKKINKLFPLMVLKNIDPIEYELLQSQDNKSEILRILNYEKQRIQDILVQKIDNYINQLELKIESINKEYLNSFDELKLILLGCISKKGYGVKSLKTEFDSFKDIKRVVFSYTNNRYSYSDAESSIDISDIETNILKEEGYFYKRERIISDKKNKINDELLKELKVKTKEKNSIYDMSFYELYDINQNDIVNISFKTNLIKLLLVNGYVDEAHMDYLSKHDNYFMTQNDKDIVQKVNRKEDIGYLTKVDDAEKVILSINDYRFRSINIINFEIINKLLKMNNVAKKKENLIYCLETNNVEFEAFLNEVFLSKSNYFKCVISLIKEIKTVLKTIINNDKIDENIKFELIMNIINDNTIDLNLIKEINIDNIFENHIPKIGTFGNEFNSKNFTIGKFLETIKIKIEKLEDFKKNINNNYILVNSCYVLNFSNICEILNNYFKFNNEDIRSKNYDLIIKTSISGFINNINDNISLYCDEVYNNIELGYLSSENLLKLLLNDKINDDTKCLIAKKETSIIEYNDKLNSKVLNIMIEKNQIKSSLEDIIKNFNIIEKNYLLLYINKNINDLEFNSAILDVNEDFKKFIFENIDIKTIINKLDKNKYKNLNIQNIDNIKALIESDCYIYDISDFRNFLGNEVIVVYCNKFENEIIEDLNDNKLILSSEEKINLYIRTNKFNEKITNKIIMTLNKNEIEELLQKYSIVDFLDGIKDFSILSTECKIVLLNRNIDFKLKELIICTINDMQNDKLIELIIKSLHIKKRKYKYINKEFCRYLKLKKILSKTMGDYLYINVRVGIK